MDKKSMMDKIAAVLDDSKTGVMATVDKDGKPHLRWMTPLILPQWPGALFAVTSPDFPKVMQLDGNNHVEWMIQTRALDQVINVSGGINILDNPSLKAQVIEAIGQKLAVFWKVNTASTDFVVLETIIEEAVWFKPMKGEREVVQFAKEDIDG
ncbi:MAG TPA: pyridoxamine 5'-phosphate oxidase family protein [Fastidiosipila sp.]|nr:pyridoxamine 5'-phosphate oxidase family protein [Fastidiosipila sp.]